MRHWILAVALAFSIGRGQAQEFKPVKVWTFALEHGSLRIDLKASSDGMSSLGFGPNGQTPEAPLAEQIQPLQQVLSEMSQLGLDPRKMAYVGTRTFTDDVLDKLAYACADSQPWKLSLQNKGLGKEQILISLLNQNDIYEPYNKVFRKYGIQAQVSAVEKVGLMKFSSVPVRNARDRADADLLVPADAVVGMHLAPVDPNVSSPHRGAAAPHPTAPHPALVSQMSPANHRRGTPLALP
jgi:hypothetical protein